MKCAHYAISFYRDQDKLPEIWEKQDIARSKDEMKAKAMKKIREVWGAYTREKESVKRLQAEKDALERDQDELRQKYNEKSRQKRRLEEMIGAQGVGRLQLQQDGPPMLTHPSSPHVHTPVANGPPNPGSFGGPHAARRGNALPYPSGAPQRMPVDRPPAHGALRSEGQMMGGHSGLNSNGDPWAKRHRPGSYVPSAHASVPSSSATSVAFPAFSRSSDAVGSFSPLPSSIRIVRRRRAARACRTATAGTSMARGRRRATAAAARALRTRCTSPRAAARRSGSTTPSATSGGSSSRPGWGCDGRRLRGRRAGVITRSRRRGNRAAASRSRPPTVSPPKQSKVQKCVRRDAMLSSRLFITAFSVYARDSV